jgi:predicted nuclease with TOPRIM domain
MGTLYKNQIDSLNEELDKMKKENTLLYEENTRLISNNQTNEIINSLSSIKSEVHDIRGIFFGEEINVKPIQKQINEFINQIVNVFGSIAFLKHEIEIKDIYQSIEGDYFAPTCPLSD